MAPSRALVDALELIPVGGPVPLEVADRAQARRSSRRRRAVHDGFAGRKIGGHPAVAGHRGGS
jgi:hypothetical protein